jgi:hypothetical protein
MTTRTELIEQLHCNALWRSPETSDLLKQAADMLEALSLAFQPDWVNYRQGFEDGKAELDKLREAARLALEALHYCEALNSSVEKQKMEAITALKEALD